MSVSRKEQSLAAAALVETLQPDAPIGFAVHDEQLRLVLLSPSMLAASDRTEEELLGQHVRAFLPPMIAGAVEAVIEEVLATGTARTGLEFEGALAGERRIWVAGYYPVTLGDRRLVGGVIVDVTERRLAEEELRESEKLLSGAQEMAALGWWTWTPDPETVTYAPELLALMGRDPALGGIPHTRDLLDVADPGRVRRGLRAALAEDRPFAARVSARRADGEIRLLDARADPVHDEAGRVTSLRGFVQDITDLARFERRQRTVAGLGQAALAGLPLEELMQRAVDALRHEPGADGAAVLELTRDERELCVRAVTPERYRGPRELPRSPDLPTEQALLSRQPVIVDDFHRREPDRAAIEALGLRARAAMLVVIGGRGRPFGLLGAMSTRPDEFAREDAIYAQALANVIADAVERRTAEAEVAELSAIRGRLVGQSLDAEERARRRISETLHDGALQELLAARVDLFALSGHGGDEAAIDAAQERLGAIIRRLREVMTALHPTVLQYHGLEAAVQAVAEEQGRAGDFEARVEVDEEAAGMRDPLLLSVVRELLTNVARHARAARAEVALRREGDELVLDVSDDGLGMPPGRLEAAVAEGKVGLASCRERMEAVGGSLTVEEGVSGLRVHARAPATAGAPDPRAGVAADGDPPDQT